MPPPLLNHIMHDGSRHFFSLPSSRSPRRFLWHILRLPALPTGYLADRVTGECWLDFRWRKQRFSLHNPLGADEYWFFVANPACLEHILQTLADYFIHQQS